MADRGGVGEAAAVGASPASVPGLNPTLGWRERLRAGLAGTGASLWFVAGLGLLYALRIPLRLCENLAAVTVFLNSLTPKFYVALTGTSSLISGLIFIFEWWYFHKHGTSFIEQVSVSHLQPLMGGTESSISEPGSPSRNRENETSRQNLSECKVWRNPLNLFRGAEYRRYTWVTGKEPLTYYDMNLSAQDHQTFFTCDTDFLRPSDTVMQKAWRERNPPARIKAAYQALELNNDCATAYVLLAEEEATTIVDAERLFKQALKAGETIYRQSQQCQHQSPQHEAQLRRDTNVLVYIKRRLAMCARKLGRIREAVKIMRDLMKEFPPLTMLNIHENLLESLLELQAYPDVQAVLAKYDDISLPKSAAICYTAALLKTRTVSEKFSPETASRRGLSTAEINAVEAIHRAVEFNPHVPKYLLEMKSLILPPEHILKRGDSEAIAYAFFHLQHWKRIEGALNLLQCTWEGTFHHVSVYPKKELPLFIHFTAGFCSSTAMIAILTHQFPEIMGIFAKAVLGLWCPQPWASSGFEENTQDLKSEDLGLSSG
ncbi:suppressor of tumorigenicity 7 protein-like isoform 3 [Homo sapiens]|uniref:Isoform 2 of Suppressor of tumorigenicity 7 protein-like n=2 Tax=Homo sapiens TaxID=9606 RepID=Q8TDW4-2|nr:suppressor of tumorigenicity 7 protein-like isoform 3 [Homo sapiens]EAW56520.1 suppression of tumorigenicity 7 like, isoform CRA_a [Homo sapiens]KAI2518440.1 suppression of tumorigenicity 7 like [Homo sapiens]BAB88873.1 ST7L isoform 3 [Homo sapiens]|eukprot:NP_620056.1 suppressor of tumorigenicity 7 protein-like isoform 3 [Homo sapiens]